MNHKDEKISNIHRIKLESERDMIELSRNLTTKDHALLSGIMAAQGRIAKLLELIYLEMH